MIYDFSSDVPDLSSKMKIPQNLRDYETIQHRMKLNQEKLGFVAAYIDRYFETHVTTAILISLAKILINKFDLKLDRLAKRNRSALLCWYAENWDLILPYLRQGKPSFIKSTLVSPNYSISDQKFGENHNLNDDFDPSDINHLLNNH